jgi:hypothetical protein
MPFVLLFLGIGLLVIAVRGTQGTALQLLESEFTGKGSFAVWVIAIVILASIGYIKPLRPLADGFIVLLLVAIVIAAQKSGKNLFASFNDQLRNPVAATPPASGAGSPMTAPGGNQQPGSILPGIVQPDVQPGVSATPGVSF